ncbi:hypothetical protein [Methyloglobulus sp.]|uniref:hypothetical protein n=1 Tax=Methyloglobulus sp. TaxID=2518622 RepID=UPI003988A465
MVSKRIHLPIIVIVLLIVFSLFHAVKAEESVSISKQQAWENYQNYRAAIVSAWQGYRDVNAKAWSIYRDVNTKAWSFYRSETSKAWMNYRAKTITKEAYEAKIKVADENYKSELKDLRQVYEINIKQIKECYDATIKQIKESYDAEIKRLDAAYNTTTPLQPRTIAAGVATQTLSQCLASGITGGGEAVEISKTGGNVASQCNAPNANIDKKLYIPGLNCRQLWEYYLYYRLSIPTFTNAQELISLAEERTLQVYKFVEKINLIGGAFDSVASSEGKMKIFNAVWESSGLALNLVPLDEARGAEFARDLINWMRESLAASVNTIATGVASPPYAVVVELANRFGALWNIQFKVLAERNAIRLADEYLTLYYRKGSDAAKVASAYGLPSSATTEDVMKSIAKQLGMGWLDYNLKKASQWVSSFKVAITNATNVCMQDSACTGSQATK